jgi:molecular chaperone DnaK
MIAAVESAFRVLGGEISAADKAEVARLLGEVRVARDSREAQRLRKANAELDKATEPLAALLVEKAMAAAQRQG